MKKASEKNVIKDYDFSKGVRGKYAGHFAEGTRLVLLDPDVAEAFPDAKSVNEALRKLLGKPGSNRK